jgi:hypothetical protein
LGWLGQNEPLLWWWIEVGCRRRWNRCRILLIGFAVNTHWIQMVRGGQQLGHLRREYVTLGRNELRRSWSELQKSLVIQLLLSTKYFQCSWGCQESRVHQ